MQHLVDLENGHVGREIFVNEAIYQQEQEQIFARTWLLVGHQEPRSPSRGLLRVVYGGGVGHLDPR